MLFQTHAHARSTSDGSATAKPDPMRESRRNRWGRRAITAAITVAACVGLMTAAGTSAGASVPQRNASTLSAPAIVIRPAMNGPVTCAIQTVNGHYLTAVGGGGRTTDVLHTDATRIGSWEKFTLIDSGDGSSNIHYGFRTYKGYYLTAVGGGGRITDVMHSNATQLLGWEKLTLNALGGGIYTIQTSNGHYLTAVGGGGRITDTIHSDATRVGSWEKFKVTCGV